MISNISDFLGNRILVLALTLWCIHLYSSAVVCSEEYYVDDQRTLLYKTINWWYDCHPEECNLYCGTVVKCTNQGKAQVEYAEGNMILKIHVEGGLAGLLTVLKKCDPCIGPSYLHCTWQNEKYLGSGKAAAVSDLNQYVIYGINKKHARTIKDIRHDIVFVVEGNIGGLSEDGTVALHQSGALFKSCPRRADDRGITYPISVKIVNANTNEVIVEYLSVWTD